MVQIIELPTHTDHRGSLTVLEKQLPFTIKRVYWLHDLNVQQNSRGRHRHKETYQALICLRGTCEVLIKKYAQELCYPLTQPHQVLVLEPDDWHEMRNFNENTLLLLLASHEYNADDYIREPLR